MMRSGKQRTFSRWQPVYAGHRIATFPVRADKTPAIRSYQKVGLRGSEQLACKFTDAEALGFMCGPRSRITVLDVDTADEHVLADALVRHGRTPVVVRTASGKWHAYYRHNGEQRRIRPYADLAIDVLGANGFVIAPPSQTATGCYQFVDGSLDDVDRLPTMRAVDRPPATSQPDSASPLRGLREHDGRNKTLFLAIGPPAREIFAAGKSRDALFELAVSHNREAREPMAVEEVNKVVDSVWQMTCEGHNWIGQRERRESRVRDLLRFKDDPDAHYLLEYLRVTEGMSAEFWIANGLADNFGWYRQRLANARQRLVELGYVQQTKRPYQGHPAVFVWPGWSRPF
jgi:hypothetical protein